MFYSEFYIKSYISITVDVSLKHTKHVSCVGLCLTSHQQLRSYGDGVTAKFHLTDSYFAVEYKPRLGSNYSCERLVKALNLILSKYDQDP